MHFKFTIVNVEHLDLAKTGHNHNRQTQKVLFQSLKLKFKPAKNRDYPKIPIKGRALYSRTNVFRVPAEALKVRKSKKYKRNYRSTLKVAD